MHNRNYPAMTTSTDYKVYFNFSIEVAYNSIVDAYQCTYWCLLASLLSTSQSLAWLSTWGCIVHSEDPAVKSARGENIAEEGACKSSYQKTICPCKTLANLDHTSGIQTCN